MTLNQSRFIKKILGAMVIVCALLWVVVPFAWIALMSLKPEQDILISPVQWLPVHPTLEHYSYLLGSTHALKYIKNSFIIASINTLLTLILATPAAYGIARFRIGGSNLSFYILSQRMTPPVTIIIPLFMVMNALRLIDTHIGLVIAHLTFNIPFAVWLLIGFFREFPIELEECSFIDGASRLQAIWYIILPIIAPGIVVTAIFCFISSWNEFLMAFILTREAAKTVTVQLIGFQSIFQPLWGELAALLMISIIPILILVFSVQRYMVRGLTAGAIKG
jgi:multiple sugar transport system permease protein